MARDNDSTLPPLAQAAPSLTAELIFAANLVANDAGRTGVPEGWVAEQRALLPVEIRSSLPRFSDFWWPTMGLVDFLCYNGHLHDPEAFLDDLERRPLDEFLSVLLNGDLPPEEVRALAAAPEGLEAAAEKFSRFSQGTLAAHRRLILDGEGHRKALIGLLRASNTPLFQNTYRRLEAESRETIRSLQHRLELENPMAVAESLWEKALMPGSGPYRAFTFVPSLLMGHRHIQCWANRQAIFFLQEGRVDLTAPTPVGKELAEFLKVLGDPTRMDILRILCCHPSYGKEIAERLKLTTATVSRHLDQLKATGLVKEDRADANNVKRLRYSAEALDGQLEKLRTYLLHT